MKKYTRETYTNLLGLARENENYRANYVPGKQELVECAYIKKLLNEGWTEKSLAKVIVDEDRPFCFRDIHLYR